MNTLYGLLTYGISQEDMSGNYYAKKHLPVKMTELGKKILGQLLLPVDSQARPMMACALCRIAVTSKFRHEVLELDPENTYNEVGRPATAAGDDPSCCLHGMTNPRSTLNPLLSLLDQDIRERLVASPWPDIMAGACLQLLRACR